MIVFNKKEKEIVRSLFRFDRTSCPTMGILISKVILRDMDIHIFAYQNGNHLLYFKAGRQQEAMQKFANVITLVEKLEGNNLIRLMPSDRFDAVYYVGNKELPMQQGDRIKSMIDMGENGYISFKDKRWYNQSDELMYDCISFTEHQVPILYHAASLGIVTSELDELVKNNFQTVEQKTLIWTRIAAIISFVALIISMILGLCAKG